MKTLPFTEHAQFIFKAMLAGVLIAMAAGTFLGCQQYVKDPNAAKIIGSFLFSIGLIGVIILNANLYTGKIGYIDSKRKAIRAVIMLFINLLFAFLIGLLYSGINGSLASINAINPGPFGPGSDRLAKSYLKMFFDGFGCGVLIYLAVELHKRTKNLIPVIICVMAFILSGTEHCIADAFYLGASELTWEAFAKLWLVVIGNTIGSISIHWLQRGAEYLNELPDNIQR